MLCHPQACVTLEEAHGVEDLKEMIKVGDAIRSVARVCAPLTRVTHVCACSQETALSGRAGLTFADFQQLLRSN